MEQAHALHQLYDGEHLSVSRQLDFLEGAHQVHGLHNLYLLEGDGVRTAPRPAGGLRAATTVAAARGAGGGDRGLPYAPA